MKIIQELSDMIEEEINDAEKYARKAIACKSERSVLAEVFYKLAGEELGHMNALHGQVVAIINEYRKAKGDPPPEMQMLYDIFHNKHIEHVAMVKALLSLYKEQ